MRIIHIVLAAAISAAIFIACKPDFQVEPPPPLEGTYKGVYRYEKSGQPVQEQHVIWVFSPNVVLMDLDLSLQPESERIFCDIEGRYYVSDGIEIYVPDTPGRPEPYYKNRHGSECDPDKGPFGKFQLDQSTKNRVVLTRNNAADTTFQRVIIDKISDEY